jgi:hypothetical protein
MRATSWVSSPRADEQSFQAAQWREHQRAPSRRDLAWDATTFSKVYKASNRRLSC